MSNSLRWVDYDDLVKTGRYVNEDRVSNPISLDYRGEKI